MKFKFHKFNRRVHLYAGLIMVPYIFIFGISGLIFNHPTMFSNRSIDTFKLEEGAGFKKIFPNINELAVSITDSIIKDKLISNPNIKNIRYSNTLILRNRNDLADYRMQVDIPSSQTQIITLPDFIIEPPIKRGNYNLDVNITSEKLIEKMEEILKNQGIQYGKSRVQRIPNLVFDLINKNKKFRVEYNITNGNYVIVDLQKRDFHLNEMLVNLHQVHGYPISGFSLTWLWVFFADILALLMIVWAVSGLIMWYKMKKQFTIGVVLLSISVLIFIIITINSYELGFL